MTYVEEALKKDGSTYQGRKLVVKRSVAKEKVKEVVAKPTGKAKVYAETRSFLVQHVSAEKISSRILEVFKGVAGCTYNEEKKDGFCLEYKGAVKDSGAGENAEADGGINHPNAHNPFQRTNLTLKVILM